MGAGAILLLLISVACADGNTVFADGMENTYSRPTRSLYGLTVGQASCYNSCPPFWTRFRDNCYRFFGSCTTWTEAEEHCNGFFNEASQGHLVSIHSKEEYAFVYKLWHDSVIQASTLTCSSQNQISPLKGIFLGLNARDMESVFVWTDGTPADFTDWGINQPSGDGDCTYWIDQSVDVSFKPWNDYSCTHPALFPRVCKLNLI